MLVGDDNIESNTVNEIIAFLVSFEHKLYFWPISLQHGFQDNICMSSWPKSEYLWLPTQDASEATQLYKPRKLDHKQDVESHMLLMKIPVYNGVLRQEWFKRQVKAFNWTGVYNKYWS